MTRDLWTEKVNRHYNLNNEILSLQELLKTLNVDAYVVVFSVNNPSTFQIAKDNLRKIRHELHINKTIIIVANKIDLVRKRAVPASGITVSSLGSKALQVRLQRIFWNTMPKEIKFVIQRTPLAGWRAHLCQCFIKSRYINLLHVNGFVKLKFC